MGAGHSQGAKEAFRREDWELVDSKLNMKTWANRRDVNFRVEQYDVFSEDQGKLNREERTYYFRKNSKYLVASIYRQCQDQGSFCSTSYRQTLFIESIPIRLSDIQHIPYPDSLHLYNQSFLGFRQLTQEVGFFPIEQEFIGVNSNGVVKVWMNDRFDKSYVQGIRVHEEAMVKSIIDTIDRNVEHTQIPSVRSYLYRNSKSIKLNQAIEEFNQYVREFNRGQIPEKLDCIDRVGGINAIVNRQQGANNQGQLFVQRNYAQTTKPVLTPVIYNGVNIQGQTQTTQPIFMPSEPINPHVNNQLRYVPMRSSEIMVEKNVVPPLHIQQNLPIVRNSRIFDIRPVQMREGQSSTRGSQIINQPNISRLTQSSHQNNHLGIITLQNPPLMTTRNPSPQLPIESTRTSQSQPPQNKIIFHQHPRPQSYHPEGQSSLLIHTKQNQQPSIIQPSIKDAILIRGAPIGSTVISSAKSSQIYQKNSGTGSLQKNGISPNQYQNRNNNPLNVQLRSIVAQPMNLQPKSNNNTPLNQKISFNSNPQGIKIQAPKMELRNQAFNNANRPYPSPQKNEYRPSLLARQAPISIGIDDGKSSDQFLKILKSKGSIPGPIKQNHKQSSQFRNALGNTQNSFSSQVNKKIGQYSLTEQIGRSAVSHHLAELQPQTHNASRQISLDATQNEHHYDIKDTTGNTESPQPYKYKYSSLNYQPSYDPQLMDDINRLKPDS